jgi:acyl-CoA synthetase (AMP-forming)/AMP-acid ligase II
MSSSKFVTFNPDTKIWTAAKLEPIFNTKVSVGSLILNQLRATPSKITQISYETGNEVSCGEMYIRTIKMAKYLQSLGLKEGDVVGFMARNSENVAPVIFACLTLGLPINPITVFSSKDEILHMFGKTKPTVIFCDAQNLELLKSAGTNAKIVTLIEKYEDYPFVDEILENSMNFDDFDIPTLNESTLALILCSSGTTGLPKGVCHTHQNLIMIAIPPWHLKAQNDIFDLVLLNTSEPFWMTQIVGSIIRGTLYGFKRIITTSPFTPETFADIMEKYNVTILLTVPPVMRSAVDVMKKPLESMRFIELCGIKPSKSLLEKLKIYFPNVKNHFISYGMSEAGYVSTSVFGYREDSSGYVAINLSVKIVNENGEKLNANESGEICLKFPFVMREYFNDPEATAATFDSEGFYKTGDFGHIDEDGFLFFESRIKEMSRYHGVFIPLAEIEEIIDSINGVVASTVVGVYDEILCHERVTAFVIINKEFKENLSEKFIENFVNEKVRDEKKIRGGVHFVESFPMTSTGKVQKKLLIEKAKEIFKNEK